MDHPEAVDGLSGRAGRQGEEVGVPEGGNTVPQTCDPLSLPSHGMRDRASESHCGTNRAGPIEAATDADSFLRARHPSRTQAATTESGRTGRQPVQG